MLWVMILSEEQMLRRREMRMGLSVGTALYIIDLFLAWTLVGVLHYSRQQYLAVPLLAMGPLFFESFLLRKRSDRVATAILLSGFCGLPIALLVIQKLVVLD